MNRESQNEKDRELLSLVALRDRAAFQELYCRLEERAFFYLFRLLGGREAAEDVMIEVFIAVWQGAGKFKGQAMVSTWVLGIARNLAMNEMRRNRLHPGLDQVPEAYLIDTGPEDSDRSRIVALGLKRISPKHREVLDLVFYHGLSYPEIAGVLEVPVNTVKTRVFHAKRSLRQQLADMGVNRGEL